MDYLGYWLLFVASLRALSVAIGYTSYTVFKEKIFDKKPMEVSPLYGRTFAIWTLLTCILTTITALNLDDKPLYIVTIVSFLLAGLHFLSEFFLYKTMGFVNLLSPGIVASVSFTWMLLEFNERFPQA